MALASDEISRLQAYLQGRFGNRSMIVQVREEIEDSADVLLGEEFFGTIYKDDDEDGVSYVFNIAILDIDLPGGEEAAPGGDSIPPDVPPAAPPETTDGG